ncbi:MAG TPA: aldehyde dehydrogenase family protein, partial [Capillimicrobium sp.]
MNLRNVVGGELVDAVDGATREILNPATGQPIATVPEGGEADVRRAVAAASEAFEGGWRLATPAMRSEALLALADLLMELDEELAGLESANVGKPLAQAREENEVSADNLRFFAAAA